MRKLTNDDKDVLISLPVGFVIAVLVYIYSPTSDLWFIALIGLFAAAGVFHGRRQDREHKAILEINNKIPKG